MRRTPLAFTAIVATVVTTAMMGCGAHAVPISPLVRPPADRSVLFVYPRMLAPGAALVVQTRLPATPNASQCLSLIGPDTLESDVSCGVVESRRVIFTPTASGRHTVRLELRIGDRLGVRREETICVVGPDADCDAPTP